MRAGIVTFVNGHLPMRWMGCPIKMHIEMRQNRRRWRNASHGVTVILIKDSADLCPVTPSVDEASFCRLSSLYKNASFDGVDQENDL